MLATAAAVGAVTTGTFTALIPTASEGAAATASAAEENPFRAMLVANSDALATATTVSTAVLPVEYSDDDPDASGDDHIALLEKASDLAKQLAELHAKQAAEQAERDRIDELIEKGGLDGWIAEALEIMDLPQSLSKGIKKIIMAESGGNPKAINTWDSNARRGTPSQGLMQTIPSTFRAYVHPSLRDRPITDPVANITAGVRYMIDNYGMSTLKAGGRSNSSGDYVGY
jgi:soluble lytic murein transglycosylase-like protein